MNRCRAAHAHPRGSPCAHTAQRSAGPGPAGGGQRGGTGGPLGLGGGMAAGCCLRGGGERVLRDPAFKNGLAAAAGGLRGQLSCTPGVS